MEMIYALIILQIENICDANIFELSFDRPYPRNGP